MFTAPLRSNERGVDHTKHLSSIVEHVHFRENMFTEPLPSNELFRLSGVMSQYIDFMYFFFKIVMLPVLWGDSNG
jgi:hypothetical protein